MTDLPQAIETRARQCAVLEPDPDRRTEWSQAVTAYAHAFIDRLPEEKAFAMPPHPAAGLLDLPIGEPHPMEELLRILQENLPTAGINPASGGHLGYIPGGGIYPAALGDYLAAVTNEYAGIFFGGPGAVRIENLLLRWLCRLVGFPDTALGNLSSGGSIANLIAFVTARDHHRVTSGRIPTSVIYLTEQVHHCVHKAIRIGGMAEAIVRTVPMDQRFRMDAVELERMVRRDKAEGLHPFLVVGSAGTTDTGAIDPLDAIADTCDRHGLWFHIDAAYGGFFLLADLPYPQGGTVREAFKGVERADSLAIDPHKGLFLPYGLGAVLVKNVQAQRESHHYQANYMQDTLSQTEELSAADLSPELTKHWRGLRMWLPLQLFGVEPFRAALEEKILLCRYFYEKIRAAGFETGPYPELSVCTYRFVPPQGDADDFNLRLVRFVQEDGRIFVSSTTIRGTVWIRLAVLSFRTHLREIDLLLSIFQQGVRHLQNHRSDG